MNKLNNKDYLAILKYYSIDTKGMKNNECQKSAKDVLANKLCRCIKKIYTDDESQAISICKNSIFTKKGLTVGRFKCKKTPSFIPSKNGETLLKIGSRTRKNKRTKRSSTSINKIKG